MEIAGREHNEQGRRRHEEDPPDESIGPPDAQRPSRQQGEAGDELGEGEEQRGRSPPRPEKQAESPRPSGRMSPTTGGEGWLNA